MEKAQVIERLRAAGHEIPIVLISSNSIFLQCMENKPGVYPVDKNRLRGDFKDWISHLLRQHHLAD